MEKLKKIIYKAIIEPHSRKKLFTQICYEIEHALHEGEDLLPCLELLQQLYPQSVDLVYLTALVLCRNEMYQEAWQLLVMGCTIFSNENVGAKKSCAKEFKKKPNKLRNYPDIEKVQVGSAKLADVSSKGHKRSKSKSSCPSECKAANEETLGDISNTNLFKEQPELLNTEKCAARFLSEHKYRHANPPESDFSSTKLLTKENTRMSGDTVGDVVTCPPSSSPIFNECKRRIRDPCYRTLQATVVNALVDRWHIPMLNDKNRNLAFKNALKNSITELIQESYSEKISSLCSKSTLISATNSSSDQNLGDNSRQTPECDVFQETSSSRLDATEHDGHGGLAGHPSIARHNEHTLQRCSEPKLVRVLDIGSGSGLLSLYAACDPGVSVMGCDTSVVMCEVAKEVIRLNSSAELHERPVLPTQGKIDMQDLDNLHQEQSHELSKKEHDWLQAQSVRSNSLEAEYIQPGGGGYVEMKRLYQKNGGLSVAEPQEDDKNQRFSTKDGYFRSLSSEREEFCSAREQKMLEKISTITFGAESEVQLKCCTSASVKNHTRRKKRFKRQSKSSQSKKKLQSIKIMNMHSTSLQLAERVDLVVSETLDAALLGEQCIPTILDAWLRLLKPPGRQSRVIPGRAEAYVNIVESAYICRYSKPLRRQNNIPTVGSISITSVSGEDPYTTERLEHLPEGHKLLSQWHKVLTIDFNSIDDLTKFSGGKADKIFAVCCSTSGEVDALTLCFKLYVDEKNVIDTRPGNNRCWETAVYPSISRRSVRAGDILAFRLAASDVIRVTPITEPKVISAMSMKMKEKYEDEDRGCTHTRSASYTEMPHEEINYILNKESFSKLEDTAQMKCTAKTKCSERSNVADQSQNESSVRMEDCTHELFGEFFFVLPPSSLRAYNSLTFTSAFRLAAQVTASKLKSCSGEVLVYDETPFPIAALELHKMLPNVTVVVEQQSVQHYLASNMVKCFTREEFMDARSSWDRNTETGAISILGHQIQREASQTPQHVLFHAMFMWPLSDLGVLVEDFDAKVTFCRRHMWASGVVYPSSIDVYGTCIASDSLLSYTRVSDDNTCGVQLASTLRLVKVSTF
ncbi:S-adenosyl-L-methionine-dependent methyltransferase [Trinorchestia longiramus]|nr:S-adenosyl-L-methionine-dependent methyltransferase [Trinorchestia longiramus]